MVSAEMSLEADIMFFGIANGPRMYFFWCRIFSGDSPIGRMDASSSKTAATIVLRNLSHDALMLALLAHILHSTLPLRI